MITPPPNIHPITDKPASRPWMLWFQSLFLSLTGLPVYANNAAALAGGLKIGSFYRTGGDPDAVCVVH